MKTHYVPVEKPDVHPAHEIKELSYATTTKIDEVDCDDCFKWLEEHGELGHATTIPYTITVNLKEGITVRQIQDVIAKAFGVPREMMFP